MTLDQQIQNLDSMVSEKAHNKIGLLLTMLAVVILIGGIVTFHPLLFMVAAFVGIYSLSAWQTAPHICNAVKGVDEGKWKRGEVFIGITQKPDSDTYYAVIVCDGKRHWKFQFIPQGWQPVEGKTEAKLAFIPEVKWPVLVLTCKGIIYPKYKPNIVNKSDISMTNDKNPETSDFAT